MARRFAALGTILTLLLLVASLPSTALAGGEGGEPRLSSHQSLEAASLIEPISDHLSGAAWLVANGLDPRLSSAKDSPLGSAFPSQEPKVRGISAQAGGGQGPLVPYRSPSPKFSRNILVTRDFSQYPYQTEPSLGVNPKDPEHVVLGVIDYSFPGITTYTSIDGGVTWEGPSQVKYPSEDLGGAGDPVIAFDRDGNAFAAAISLDVEDFTIGNAIGSAVIAAIPIAKSEDGGFNWEEPIASSRSHITTTTLDPDEEGRDVYELSLPFLDKPWLTIGPNKEKPEEDVIYVTYTKFVTKIPVIFLFGVDPITQAPLTETSIELVRSEDGGRTWSEPIAVSPVVISAFGQDDQRVVQGSQPAVAPDGTLYVTWMDSTDDDTFEGRAEVHVARSDDNGHTFVTKQAADFNEVAYSPRNSLFRFWASGFPQISTGPQGEVYVVYTAKPPDGKRDDGDIFFLASTDKGETWSRKRLNDDATDRVQFFPSVSAGPDGMIHVMWGDMRDDPVEARYHIYYTSSEDGGETWIENARVTDFPSNPNYAFPGGAFIGDYFTIKATETDVYMAWPDARLGEYGPLNQKIGFARKELMPLPSIFLSPPSGAGGKDITIQGSNFQPDQDVYLEISGAVISTVRTDADGRFAARIFIPISGEGAHDFRAIDASGNIATGSFFMDFGFDTIQEAVEGITTRLDSLQQGSGGGGNGPSMPTTDTSPPSDISAQLQNIQERLGGLELEERDEESDSGSIIVVVIAVIAAFLAATVGVVVGTRLARPRQV